MSYLVLSKRWQLTCERHSNTDRDACETSERAKSQTRNRHERQNRGDRERELARERERRTTEQDVVGEG